jgi:hypothetical protein
MNIKEFAQIHCQDIIDIAQDGQGDLVLDGLPYDEIIREDDGAVVRVVTTTSHQIPIFDIIEMDREQFLSAWPGSECIEAYDNYRDAVTILEGPELLAAARQALKREQELLNRHKYMPEIFLC